MQKQSTPVDGNCAELLAWRRHIMNNDGVKILGRKWFGVYFFTLFINICMDGGCSRQTIIDSSVSFRRHSGNRVDFHHLVNMYLIFILFHISIFFFPIVVRAVWHRSVVMRWKVHEHISALKAWYGLSELWLIWRMWWYWLPPLAFVCLSIRRHVHIQFTNCTWNERCAAVYTVDEIALKFKHYISTLIRSVLFFNQFQQLHFTSELSCAPCVHAAMRSPEECARCRDINNNSLECFQSYCGIVCAHRCIHLRYTSPDRIIEKLLTN